MIWLAIKRGVGLAVFLALAGIAALFAGTAQSDDAARFAGARRHERFALRAPCWRCN